MGAAWVTVYVMTTKTSRSRSWRRSVAILSVALIVSSNSLVFAQQAATAAEESPKIPMDKLDSLVAPIALYADSFLTTDACSFDLSPGNRPALPMDQKNLDLKSKEISEAVKKQDWDPSIQAMAAFPDVVKNCREHRLDRRLRQCSWPTRDVGRGAAHADQGQAPGT
jgi:hypothetical protein